MTTNIIRTLETTLIETLAQHASPLLNETHGKVRKAVEFLLPNLVGALTMKASTPEGSSALFSVLDSHADELKRVPNDPVKIFADDAQTHSVTALGAKLFHGVFGQKSAEAAELVAAKSGTSTRNAQTLLNMVTPFLFQTVRTAAQDLNAFGASQLGPMLQAQKGFVSGALSPHFFTALGLHDFASWLGFTNTAKPAPATTVPATADERKKRGNGLRVLLWLLLALALLLLLGYCARQKLSPTGSDTVQSVPQSANVPAPSKEIAPSEPAIPTGAGTLAELMEGRPVLKVYFDYGKSEVGADFQEKAKDLIAYLKDHKETKVQISGFTDSSGDKATNEALAKKRAEAVQAALVGAGIDSTRVELLKPADATEEPSRQQGRRAEVRLVQ